jgi:hypothetical protein
MIFFQYQNGFTPNAQAFYSKCLGVFLMLPYKNTSIPGGSFCARLSNYIIKMKKEKTFNQEVEHFGRVLEAEIVKKEH